MIPARTLLLVAGVISIALGSFNLGHELHSKNVDIIYTVVGAVVAIVWLVSVVLAWRGSRAGVFLAGLIAFVEFGVISAGHFVTAPFDIDIYANHEGLALATVLIAILPACALTAMAAIVCWSHATGRVRDPQTIPLLVVTVIGAILVVLYTTDSVSRRDFGTMLPEDAAFVAVAAMVLWLVGAFWIAHVRRVGAILIGLGTFIVLYPFITLHVLAGTSVSAIASKSGPVWAGIALAMATLAAASFIAALALVVDPLVRRQSGKRPPSGP